MLDLAVSLIETPVEDHHQLVEIYAWVIEGFNTKDLQEAKVLLEQLT